MKAYEADMRHLLDSYIQAEDPEDITPFEGLSLLDIISDEGVTAALNTLSKKMKGNKGAIAETIENNVRRKIIKDHHLNPAFFDKMSKLLNELIKLRKENAISYEEHLKRIADLVNKTQRGHEDDTPDDINTQGRHDLYECLGKDKELVLLLDEVIKVKCPANWRGNSAKEKTVKGNIYQALVQNLKEENVSQEQLVAEPPEGYGLPAKVEKIFKVIEKHPEY
jgi:type I restriction enzyme R subunit